ncbi:hypothetical protein RRF57_001132 [Xylaria bambusicola]|uniref:Uncharacterized protein n=1 Tax=Xylaria bambusicola TaxID=326684 RepID=A0AAN7Z5Z4_9PEZI
MELPLREHESSLKVLGELPFDTVKSIMKHQWRKDVTKIIYTHAQYYHDESLVNLSLCQKLQLEYLEEDLKSHRTKYILHYLHAVVEAYRDKGIGATQVTMKDEILVRSKLSYINGFSREKEALTYDIPEDLDIVFRQAKPFEWKGTMTWDQCKKNSMCMAEQVYGKDCVRDVVDRQLITVISIILRLDDKTFTFVPKTPDPMWCWNQPMEQIEGFQHMTKLDLF